MAKNSEKTQAEIYREQRKARLAKAAAKNQKKKVSVTLGKGAKAAIAVVIVAAIAAGILAYAASATGFKYKHHDVYEVGDGIATVSAAEFSYYYNQAFNYYFQMSYQYDSYYGSGMGKLYTGYDYSVLPDEQAYSGKIEGIENPTWADYLRHLAEQSIIQTKAYVKLAKDAGLELDDENIESINTNLDNVKKEASEQNYSVTAYLQQYYGKGVTKTLVKKVLEDQALATKYQEMREDEFAKAKTEKEILKEYNSDKDAYDKVSIAYYLVAAEEVKSTDEDGKETSAVTKETMAKAKKTANGLMNKDSLEEFTAAVDKAAGKEDSTRILKAIDNSTLSQYASSGYIAEDAVDWIYGGAKAGEMKMFEAKDSGYYVCFAIAAPYRDDVKPVSVRHILIKFTEEDDKKEDSEDKEAKTEIKESENLPALSEFKDAPVYNTVKADKAKQAETYNSAEILLREYLNGDRSEQSFADLATKYSEDTASTTEADDPENGGLYADVTVGQMVDEFNDWIFDENRKAGDVGIVETTYGYHIIYFVSTAEETAWAASIRESLAHEDLDKLSDDTLADEAYKLNVLNESYIGKVADQTKKLAETFIYNIKRNQSSAG